MGAVERSSRAKRARRPIAVATLAAAALALAGCSASSDTATATTTIPASSAPQTAATAVTSSTAAPGAASGAAALGGSDSDSDIDSGGPDAGSTARDPSETTAADEVAPGVDWSTSASEYRAQDGLLVAYDCPPDGVASAVWGTDIYTDDSSVCSAGVHLGLITEVEGGEVVIQISGGLDEYEGSSANGVTSLPYGSWGGSFTFVG